MTKWEQLLHGQKIRVVTLTLTLQPLRYLSGDLANNNARLVRWRLFLQSWDLVIQYRKGNADSLSRLETAKAVWLLPYILSQCRCVLYTSSLYRMTTGRSKISAVDCLRDVG